MALHKNKSVFQPELSKPAPAKKFKWMAAIAMVFILTGLGFALGIYLKFIDLHALADRWQLRDYPVIGRYIVPSEQPPQLDFEQLDKNGQRQTDLAKAVAPLQRADAKAPTTDNAKDAVDTAQLEKLMKQRQQEDNKRIAKLARLYGSMKASDAVNVLQELNDADLLAILNKMEEDQASKILAVMSTGRSARLTEMMLRGAAVQAVALTN